MHSFEHFMAFHVNLHFARILFVCEDVCHIHLLYIITFLLTYKNYSYVAETEEETATLRRELFTLSVRRQELLKYESDLHSYRFAIYSKSFSV